MHLLHHVHFKKTECVCFLSGMSGATVLILVFVQMNKVPSGVWKLLPRMTQTCGGPQLFSEVLGNFFEFYNDVKKRGTGFEARP